MVHTKFLTVREFKQYRNWLNERSHDSLALYFGVATSDDFLQSVVNKVLESPDDHHFLVAMIGNKWVGVIHMARISETQMEFGIMVDEQHRGEGIADTLMQEALTWIQNRGYEKLFLHCLNRNTAMKHLAKKYGLNLHEDHGDIDAAVVVPPPSILSYIQEANICQKNIFFTNLQNAYQIAEAFN